MVAIDEWLGTWVSFERLIDSDDPHLVRAWREATEAMKAKPMFALMMLGDARRFWRFACTSVSRGQRARIAGWRITPLPGADAAVEAGSGGDAMSASVYGFVVDWLGEGGRSLGRYAYRLDHMVAKGLEGKPCYVFHAVDAPEGCPFRVLIAMDPMPERAALARGGLLSHLHFQYAARESALLKGDGERATLRRRMWYPTMCAGEGDLLARCNIVRALHQLPAWPSLP